MILNLEYVKLPNSDYINVCDYKNTHTSTDYKVLNLQPPVAQATANARIIFNSGSQRSLLANRVKDSLSETILIKTFRSSSDGKKACDIVKLGIKLKNDNDVELPLFSVPFICEPLSNQDVDLKIPN